MSREFPKNPEPQKVAVPTVGRLVYVYGPDNDLPLAALVTGLWDGLTIDACVFSGNGVPQPTQGIAHITEPRPTGEIFWDWMPYQKGQAAKTEELEAQLKSSFGGPKGGGMVDAEIGKQQAAAPFPLDGKR